MRFVFALILFGHGFAHLVGFVVPWRLKTLPQLPYKTAALANSINLGDWGVRVVGVLWLVAAFAFGVSSVAVLTRHTWWLPVTICVTAFSLVLCVIGWPDARIGLFVDIAILAVLLLGLRSPAFLHLFGL